MVTLLLGVALAAKPPAIVVPEFRVVGIEQQLAEAWLERFVTLLGQDGSVRIITARDTAQLLGLERQKQLAGCTDDSANCLAELAGALGADGVLAGSIAKGGGSVTSSLRILRASDGSIVWSATTRVRDEDQLQDWLETQVAPAIHAVLAKFGPTGTGVVSETTRQESPTGRPLWVRLLPGVAGAVAAVVGLGFYVASKNIAAGLRAGSYLTAADIRAAASAGATNEGLGIALMCLGGAALVASVFWAVVGGRDEPPPAGLTVLPAGGIAFTGGGRF